MKTMIPHTKNDVKRDSGNTVVTSKEFSKALLVYYSTAYEFFRRVNDFGSFFAASRI